MQTTCCLQLGAAECFGQALSSALAAGTVCAGEPVLLAGLLLREGLQPVLGQVLAAGAEGVVEGGREAGDVGGDVGKDLWRRLVVVADLEGGINETMIQSLSGLHGDPF